MSLSLRTFLSGCLGVLGLIAAATAEQPVLATFTSGGLKFEERSVWDGGQYVYGLTAVDVDADGDLDLTTADARVNNLLWHENDGKGGLTLHVIGENDPGYLERHDWGDINDDGKLDVVIMLNKLGHVLWFEQGESPKDPKSWKRHVISEEFLRAYDVELADLDGDGDLDVAASAYTGDGFSWFENPGKDAVTKPWKQYQFDKAPEIANTRTIAAVDFNRDGKLDLLGTGTFGHHIVWYEHTGQPGEKMFRRHVIDNKTLAPTHGHPVDLDGDGDLDFVMASGMRGNVNDKNSNQAAWYENLDPANSGLGWKKHLIGNVAYGFEAVTGDLDGDGDLDVIASGCSGGGAKPGQLCWFENSGDPKAAWKRHPFKDYPSPCTIIVMDLDGDGKLDIACGSEEGLCRWWRNVGK
jgi:hypothetical protein